MEFAKGLTPHTILMLIDKPEKIVTLSTQFSKLNLRVVTAGSLYEGLKVIDQEMPHLVVCDAIIADGTAGNLYDRMQQQVIFKDIPILVLVASKTKDQLNPLKGRKFAGFLLGKIDGRALLAKIKEILEGQGDVSPFFATTEQCRLENDCTLSMPARVIGRVEDQLVCQSESEVDGNAALFCQPLDKAKGPVLLKFGSNVHKEGILYNLFPVNVARGIGRAWLDMLPQINLDQASKIFIARRVLFYDPQLERFERFKTILNAYGFELIHAASLQSAASIMVRETDGGLGCVYLDELPLNASGVAFKDALSKMKEKFRPAVIAGTASLDARSTKEIRFLKKPFGLGTLIECLDQAIKSRLSLAEGASANVDVLYQTPAKLLGLDETGGIVQLRFPVVPGCRLTLHHPTLVELWEGNGDIRIIHVVYLEGREKAWQAKFEKLNPRGNKSKYWERLSKQLSQRVLSEIA